MTAEGSSRSRDDISTVVLQHRDPSANTALITLSSANAGSSWDQINVVCLDSCAVFLLNSYVLWVPGGVFGLHLHLDHDVRHQNHQQHDRTDSHPAGTPKYIWLSSCHELDILTEPAERKRDKVSHTHTHTKVNQDPF